MHKDMGTGGKNTSQSYDSIYKKDSSLLQYYSQWGLPVYKRIMDYLEEENITGGKLIDLGCGSGQFLKTLSDKGMTFDMTAVDFSTEALERVKEKGINNLKAVKSNLNNLDEHFEKDYFDVAASIGTHEHIYDYIVSFQQINRILKNEGIFILALPKPRELKGDWFDDGEQVWWRKSRQQWLRDLEICGFRLASEDLVAEHWIFILRKI